MKRIYSETGQSTPLWFLIVCLVLAGPFFFAWIFLSNLFREMWRAFRYAWLEVRIEWASLVDHLRKAK